MGSRILTIEQCTSHKLVIQENIDSNGHYDHIQVNTSE